MLNDRDIRELRDKAGRVAAQIEQARSALTARHERITRHVVALETELSLMLDAIREHEREQAARAAAGDDRHKRDLRNLMAQREGGVRLL